MTRSLFLLAPLLAATPAMALPAGEESVHIVTEGETLNGIANRAGVTAKAIAEANGIGAPYIVRIGQELAIPRESMAPAAKPATASSTYTVTSGETLYGIANRTGIDAKVIAEANSLDAPYLVKIGQVLTIPATTAAPSTRVRTAARTIPARAQANASPAPASAKVETTHLVTSGETLGGIAARAGVPRVLIAEANGLEPPYVVRIGQNLKIPRTRHHVVAQGDTGFGISLEYAVPWESVALANDLDPQEPLKPGQNLLIPTLLDPQPRATSAGIAAPRAATPAPQVKASRFAWPVTGPIRRTYASGSNYHDGLDITAARGTMVRAAAPGTVRFAGKEPEQFGNLVVLDHGDGWFTAYGFLSRITVKEGASVAAGERIGLVGDTGLAKGNELHFEMRHDGEPVDPLDELPDAP